MRFEGNIKSWNDAKGFGFLAPTQGGQDIFIHVSSLPRGTGTARVGQAFTFEVELNRDGKKRAVKVAHVGQPLPAPNRARSGQSSRASPFASVVGVLLVAVLAVAMYGKVSGFFARASGAGPAQAQSVEQPAQIETAASVPPSFRCDGRVYCSQMTSCAEARYFLKSCPGVKMDGNGDGVPCEQQWCTGPLPR